MNKSTTFTRLLGNFKKTEFVLFMMIIVILVVMTLMTDTFLSVYNIQIILTSAAIVGILSIASTLVIVTAGIDLSIGSVVGCTANTSAQVWCPVSLKTISRM